MSSLAPAGRGRELGILQRIDSGIDRERLRAGGVLGDEMAELGLPDLGVGKVEPAPGIVRSRLNHRRKYRKYQWVEGCLYCHC